MASPAEGPVIKAIYGDNVYQCRFRNGAVFQVRKSISFYDVQCSASLISCVYQLTGILLMKEPLVNFHFLYCSFLLYFFRALQNIITEDLCYMNMDLFMK